MLMFREIGLSPPSFIRRDIIYWSPGVYTDIIVLGNQEQKLSQTSVFPHCIHLYKVERFLTCQGQDPRLVSWPLMIRGESGESGEISRNCRGFGRLKLANSGLSPQSGDYFDYLYVYLLNYLWNLRPFLILS